MAGLPEHSDNRVRYGDAWRRASEGSEGEPVAAVAKEAVDGDGREQDDGGKGVGRRHQAMQWKASAVSRLVPAAPRCQWKVLAGKRGLEEEDEGTRKKRRSVALREAMAGLPEPPHRTKPGLKPLKDLSERFCVSRGTFGVLFPHRKAPPGSRCFVALGHRTSALTARQRPPLDYVTFC
uniref:Uncharacterized protein n=1 Tax=Oryza sativa subsp. japonica TaxID=39947 RepID=Q60EP2_ORYSJ|nr:hypothetical protein [Oryza sativa Japonica Group]